ncbi:MAG: 4-hydroxybenzoate octaprenyltransferase [Oleiphilaceae bacterium]|nr:4-hydroxybenzoate octaprenyltransferase [Oleiphilaceae bacterium]
MKQEQEQEQESALPPSGPVWKDYFRLARFDRPIGTFLVLWPTLWALWLAAEGVPSLKNLVIFTLGAIVMRAAGCVINDYADRDFDGHVERTKDRPLATGRISPRNALIFFAALCLIALVLVLQTNTLTIYLSFGALALASAYPFMKRYTYMPQVVLGAAFAWAVPMAYAAETNSLPSHIWLIYLATVLWTVAYDTLYARVDREDDLKVGIKSTAILFGEADRAIIALLQLMVLLVLALVGDQLQLGQFYYLGLVVVSTLFVYQQHLIRLRYRHECFRAFLNNNWVGLAIFVGIALDYMA